MLFLHSLSNTALPGRSCHPGCRRTSSVSLKCIVFIINSLPFSFLPLCTLLWNALNYVCTDMYYAFNGEAFMYWVCICLYICLRICCEPADWIGCFPTRKIRTNWLMFLGFFFLLAYELALSGSWEFDQRQDQTFGLLPPKLKKNYKVYFVNFFNKLSCLISINSYN